MAILKIFLFGKFYIEGSDGGDRTPRGSKAQAIVALLATGQNYSRTRTWLQDKLWSDRQREQGAASLRQALMDVRASFGEDVAVLLSDRKSIGLDPAKLSIAKDCAGGADGAASGEFLEGLDVRDNEFNDWLRLQRSAHDRDGGRCDAGPYPDTTATRRARRALIVEPAAGLEGMEGYFATAFGDTVATALREMVELDLLEAQPAGTHDHLVLRTKMTLDGQRAGLRVSLDQGWERRKIWSGSRLVRLRGAAPVDEDDVLRMVNEATERILMALGGLSGEGAHHLSLEFLMRRAIQKLFSMDPAEQLEADNLLSAAFVMSGRAVFLAWRVMLRLIMLVERHADLPTDYEEEARLFSMQALELDPGNSLVLAAAANAHLFLFGDVLAAEEFAKRSASANPANPFAWDCKSMVALYQGDTASAHRLQQRARYIAGNSHLSHWFDMGCCLTATLTGRYEAALELAHRAAAMAPGFHPPLRYLIALYARNGDYDKARQLVHRLGALERGFSVDRFVNEVEYPVSALRKSGLLGRDLVTALN